MTQEPRSVATMVSRQLPTYPTGTVCPRSSCTGTVSRGSLLCPHLPLAQQQRTTTGVFTLPFKDRHSVADVSAFLFDVDGTLIDSNAAHAETWAQALREHGIACDVADVRPLVGMGGDKLLARIAHLEEDSPDGRSIGQRKKALFAERLPHLSPTPGARALIAYLHRLKKTLVVATSADDREMRALLEQAGVADLIPLRISKDDATQSKPDPDILQAALKRAQATADKTIMIGDTPFDVEAAHRAGIDSIALRCGGYWSDADLQGALVILEDPAALLAYWATETSGTNPLGPASA